MSEKSILEDRVAKSFKERGFIDVVELANSFGIEVYDKDFGSDESSYIIYDEDAKFKIYFNIKHPKKRQRFSIAHEIAHYILHKNEIIERKKIARQHNESLCKEKEDKADELAAEILSPKNVVYDFVEGKGINKKERITEEIVQEFSKKFNISFVASILRLRNLDYYVPYM